jgi:hypothetical protein
MALARKSHRRYAPIQTDRPKRPTYVTTAGQVAKADGREKRVEKRDDLMQRILKLAEKAVERDVHITLPPPPENKVNVTINDQPVEEDPE